MPGYDDWGGKEHFPSHIEAAYRAAKRVKLSSLAKKQMLQPDKSHRLAM
jgi:hypothetical protein